MNNNKNFINTTISAEGKKLPSAVCRKCIACGNIKDRQTLVRILIEAKTQKIIINPDSKHFGKSKYLCNNLDCLNYAIKKKRLKFLSDEDLKFLKSIIEK